MVKGTAHPMSQEMARRKPAPFPIALPRGCLAHPDAFIFQTRPFLHLCFEFSGRQPTLHAHLRRRTDAPGSVRTSRNTTRLEPCRPDRAVGARIAQKPLLRASVAIVCGSLKPGGPA